jgi:hypothetical protein
VSDFRRWAGVGLGRPVLVEVCGRCIPLPVGYAREEVMMEFLMWCIETHGKRPVECEGCENRYECGLFGDD